MALTSDGEVVSWWRYCPENDFEPQTLHCEVGKIDPEIARRELADIASLSLVRSGKYIWAHPDTGGGWINLVTEDGVHRSSWDETQSLGMGGVYSATDEQIVWAGEYVQAKIRLARAISKNKGPSKEVEEVEELPECIRGDAEGIEDMIRVAIWRGREKK